MSSYHKKFLADFLRSPRDLSFDFSLRLLFAKILEAKLMSPPIAPPVAGSTCAGWFGIFSSFVSDLLLLSILSVSSRFLCCSLLLRANLSSDRVSKRGDLNRSGEGLNVTLSAYLVLDPSSPALLRNKIVLASSTDFARFCMISTSL